MSLDRWILPRARLAPVLAFVLAVAVSAQADDTWHNVYHSLRRFFTGKSGATPTPHHHVRRSADHDKADHSMEPSPSPAEASPSPDASAAPRVVILPATSPTPEATPATSVTPAPENSVRAPQAVVQPEASPDLGPVLRSLPGPSPASSPAAPPSPPSGTGKTTTD
jgi:hypothetical protein